MFNTIRVAALAAAAAFLCTGNAAAAQEIHPSPAVGAEAATPVTAADTNIADINVTTAPVPDFSTITADWQVLSTAPAPVAQPSTADTALTASRVRPDRAMIVETAPVQAAIPAQPRSSSVGRSLADLVSEHARAETGDQEFECLARAVYFESRGEPLDGQLAVAEVILNRVKSGRFRATVCDVVKQPSQFSFVRRGVIPQAPRESSAWHRAVAIAHIAMQDLHDVTGENSLFFHATYVNPAWGRPARRIARIGNHIFYR